MTEPSALLRYSAVNGILGVSVVTGLRLSKGVYPADEVKAITVYIKGVLGFRNNNSRVTITESYGNRVTRISE
eukprot:IDg6889t1